MENQNITLWQIILWLPLYKKYKTEDIINNYWIEEFKNIKLKVSKEQISIFAVTRDTDRLNADVFFEQLNYIKNPDLDKLDTYCNVCKRETPFEYNKNYILINEDGKNYNQYMEYLHNNIFFLNYYCTRCNQNEVIFLIKIEWDYISKIAQNPTELDLLWKDFKKYEKILDDSKINELKKSIISYSNNYWIPAYLYLRRIFEYLIQSVYNDTKNEYWISDNDFRFKDTKDKIDLLKIHLPDFLVDHKNIYSILSKWVHELNEDECLKYYDILKESIILILDQKLELLEKKDKQKNLTKLLSGIN